jgi:hypothetical protein
MSYNSYESLRNYLGSKDNRPSPYSNPKKVRIIASSEDSSYIDIKYHNTVILRFFWDGKIQLWMNSWNTRSTRKHMNEFLPFRIHIHTKNYNPFIQIDYWKKSYPELIVVEINFEEGMLINPETGEIHNNKTKEVGV